VANLQLQKAKTGLTSEEESQRLTQPETTFYDFLRNSLLMSINLKIERDNSPCRDVNL